MDIVAAGLAGWLIGSLTSTLVDSIPLADQLADLLQPSCPHCDAPRRGLAWSAVVAVVTGQWDCEYCGSPRGIVRLLWELVAVAGSILVVTQDLGPSGPWISVGMLGFFFLLTAVDLHYRLIPLIMVVPAAGFALLAALLDPTRGLTKSLAGGAAGFALVFLMFTLGGLYGRWVARRRGGRLEEVPFGFGDVTLSTFIGLAVGWPGVILALVIGVLGAGAYSLAAIGWMALRREYDPFMPFPYGPFLILGAATVYFGGQAMTLLAGP